MFSDDGHRFIAMTCRGDLRTNLNIYSVLLFNAEHLERTPKELLKVSLPGGMYPRQLALRGNQLTVLIGFHGKPAQAVSINLRTKAMKLLTNHPTGIVRFAAAATTG